MTIKITRYGMTGAFHVECSSYIFKDDKVTTFDSDSNHFCEFNEVKQIEVIDD